MAFRSDKLVILTPGPLNPTSWCAHKVSCWWVIEAGDPCVQFHVFRYWNQIFLCWAPIYQHIADYDLTAQPGKSEDGGVHTSFLSIDSLVSINSSTYRSAKHRLLQSNAYETPLFEAIEMESMLPEQLREILCCSEVSKEESITRLLFPRLMSAGGLEYVPACHFIWLIVWFDLTLQPYNEKYIWIVCIAPKLWLVQGKYDASKFVSTSANINLHQR